MITTNIIFVTLVNKILLNLELVKVQTAQIFERFFWGYKLMSENFESKFKQETLRVVTITMICSTLASSWKFQYFQKPIYNPDRYLWWSFYCKSSKPLAIFTKSSVIDAHLGSRYASAFTWRLFKHLFL